MYVRIPFLLNTRYKVFTGKVRRQVCKAVWMNVVCNNVRDVSNYCKRDGFSHLETGILKHHFS